MRLPRLTGLSLVLLGVVLSLSLLMACSAGQGARGGTASATSSSEVIIKDLQFRPETVTVKKGGTVTWKNEDTTAHTSTSDDFNSDTPTSSPPGSWNSPVIDRGRSWSRRFDESGKFPYSCSIHPYIKGTVVVQP